MGRWGMARGMKRGSDNVGNEERAGREDKGL